MKTEELVQLVQNGKRPIVKFTKNVYEYVEESVDAEMMGKVVGVSQEYEDSYRFLVDLNDFMEHNKSVASHDWIDSNGDAKHTWFDTRYYPKDGIEAVYLPINIDVPIQIIDDHSLLGEYCASGSDKGYIEWLEEQVINFREKIGKLQIN